MSRAESKRKGYTVCSKLKYITENLIGKREIFHFRYLGMIHNFVLTAAYFMCTIVVTPFLIVSFFSDFLLDKQLILVKQFNMTYTNV